jgi:predicted RNA polymerase sigma factor
VLQAALAACHARARRAADTDWPRIAALYDRLRVVAPSPVVDLNRAIAHSMALGPEAGLGLLARANACDCQGSGEEVPR